MFSFYCFPLPPLVSTDKLIRVGRQEVVLVLRVDKEKGYIDLSKRRVTPEDVAATEEKFNKSKAVHSIMKHVAERVGGTVEEQYNRFGWPLYKKYGHAYEAFKAAVTDPETILAEFKLGQEVQDTLLKNIRQRLTPAALKLRADLELTCFTYEGIDAIKESFRAGEAVSTEEIPIKIKLVAPPLYVMVTSSLSKDAGIAALNQAIEAIRTSITAAGGSIKVKVEPRAVSERDEKDLKALLETLDKANREVSGDDDISDEES